MPKFETEFVYCMWNENLKGKNCFLADSIVKLQERVESNDTKFLDTVVSRYNGDYPFRIDNGNYFRFCYYDPYYDLKLAREQGKVIQRYWKSEQEWDEYIGDDFPDDISFYRIKPEEQKPVTSREISRWLAQGNGEYRAYNDKVFPDVRRTEYLYEQDTEPVTEVKIRKWEDTEWHEPTREYMGLEENKMNITDYFPVGTKIVIEVVPRSGYCRDCIFFETRDCDRIMCTAYSRKDNKNILFKLVEVKEP